MIDLNRFKGFILLHGHVRDCIRRDVPKPWTGDLVMDGYDFHITRQPSRDKLLVVLRDLGIRRPTHFEKGVFVFDQVRHLSEMLRLAEDEIERLLVGFDVYCKLSDGKLRQWKTHKTRR